MDYLTFSAKSFGSGKVLQTFLRHNSVIISYAIKKILNDLKFKKNEINCKNLNIFNINNIIYCAIKIQKSSYFQPII